ncbi:hypothetical protein F5X99DRAFT_404683 [Biscogniauxia marginata]|nr:hypothetical protein F5X99DRAFT_404683 [Biscogniauxia marginata]
MIATLVNAVSIQSRDVSYPTKNQHESSSARSIGFSIVPDNYRDKVPEIAIPSTLMKREIIDEYNAAHPRNPIPAHLICMDTITFNQGSTQRMKSSNPCWNTFSVPNGPPAPNYTATGGNPVFTFIVFEGDGSSMIVITRVPGIDWICCVPVLLNSRQNEGTSRDGLTSANTLKNMPNPELGWKRPSNTSDNRVFSGFS